MKSREYGSYGISIPFTLILASLGLFTNSVALFVAAAIPSIYLLLSSLTRKPEDDSIKVTRNVKDEAPSPGKHVEIEVIVENTGRTTLTDLRVLDLVPEGLEVVSGSPRASIALTPGSKTSFTYSVVARRGNYVFNNPEVEIRGRGSKAYFNEIEAEGDQKLECKTGLEETVLRDRTEAKAGDIVTSEAGEGLEFHSLRDYKSGDPMSRVEWRKLAKTGELATKNFREERSGRIILIIDSRKQSNIKAGRGHPTAVDLSAYAAERTYSALMKSRHKVGLGILGQDASNYSKSESHLMPYVKPGRGAKTRKKIEEILEKTRNNEKNQGEDLEKQLYELLPPNSQVIFFTPLLDDELKDTLKVLNSHGFPTIVVSPDVTYSSDSASRIESIKRSIRMKKVRKHSPVVNWDVNQPISIQISKALKRVYGGDLG